jgi:hypothetical protein
MRTVGAGRFEKLQTLPKPCPAFCLAKQASIRYTARMAAVATTGAVSNNLIRSGFHAGCGATVKILLFSEA